MLQLPSRGCRIDDGEPQECVLDNAAPELCLYAGEIRQRHECPWWYEEELQHG